MNKSADCRRGRVRRGFLTTTTIGSLCLGMLATSLTSKEIMFRARCANTELANKIRPAAQREPGAVPEQQVAQVPEELEASLAKR